MIGVGDFRASPRARELVSQVLESGRLSYGPVTEQLEQAWADIHRTRHAIAVTSGTAALDAVLRAAKTLYGWPDGSEVIIPAVTFVATANACLLNNLVPVPVDVRPHTGNIDPALIPAAITDETVAIIPVHLFGQPAEMQRIMSIARFHDLFVLEDSCETFAAGSPDGLGSVVPVGGWGGAAAFSTYVAHHVPAGIGGFVTTNDTYMHDAVRSIVNHGRNLAYWNVDMAVSDPSLQFRFGLVGHNYRTHELVSALALAEIENDRWRENVLRRREIAHVYTDAFRRLDHVFDITTTEGISEPSSWSSAAIRHSWMMYPVFYKPADERPDLKFEFMAWLRDEGVDSRETLPLINQPVYQRLFRGIDAPNWLRSRSIRTDGLYEERRYPVAARMNRTGFYLPCHHLMTLDDANFVIRKIREFVV